MVRKIIFEGKAHMKTVIAALLIFFGQEVLADNPVPGTL